MKCYLHIGVEKTATKTLQEFLYLNAPQLAQFGYAYTKGMGLTNNILLPVIAYDSTRRDEFTRSRNISTDNELRICQSEIKRELREEIQSISGPNVVFSSEHIQSRLTRKRELIRLRETMLELGVKTFRIVVYLRNPAELASSLYSTGVRYGSTLRAPPPPTNEYFSHICHHENTLKAFGSVFGTSALIPRLFEPGEYKNGSIIEDFVASIDAPWSKNYTIPQNLNQRISALGLQLLGRLNRVCPAENDYNYGNLSRDELIMLFESSFNAGPYEMPEELRRNYDATFQESNEWVRKNWFPSRDSLFATDNTAIGSTANTSKMELDQLSELLAKLLSKNPGGFR